MDVNKSNNSLWKAGTGAFAILSAILGYLLFEAKGISKDQNLIIDQRVAEISSARMSLDSIGMQMDAKIAEIKNNPIYIVLEFAYTSNLLSVVQILIKKGSTPEISIHSNKYIV